MTQAALHPACDLLWIPVQRVFLLELLVVAILLTIVPYVLIRSSQLPVGGPAATLTNRSRGLAGKENHKMKNQDWTKPRAMAIPREGYFTLEKGDMARPNL
jgi:hypothetical protein